MLEPGASTGSTNVRVKAEDKLPIHATLDYNNYGLDHDGRRPDHQQRHRYHHLYGGNGCDAGIAQHEWRGKCQRRRLRVERGWFGNERDGWRKLDA